MMVELGASNSVGSGLPFFSDAVTVPVQIKGSLGQIYLLDLMNSAAATSYLHIFFLPVAQVNMGVTVPDLVIKLPTNAGSGFTKTIPFPVPVGALGLARRVGSGLTVAGSTSATVSAATVAIGVSAVYL